MKKQYFQPTVSIDLFRQDILTLSVNTVPTDFVGDSWKNFIHV